jgi:hypothetical protein
MVAMKSAIIGLLAIPVIIGLLSMSIDVSACTGGREGQVYLEKTVTAAPGNYSAEQFAVEKADKVRMNDVVGGRVLILTDAHMANFTAGRNYDTMYNSSVSMDNISKWVYFTPGKYWAVLDNRFNNNSATVLLKVERPYIAYKDGCSPFPVPGFDALPAGFVLVLISIVAGSIAKKRN